MVYGSILTREKYIIRSKRPLGHDETREALLDVL